MSNIAATGETNQFRLDPVEKTRPAYWVRAGLCDFRAAPWLSIGYSGLFVLAGYLILAVLVANDMTYFFLPMATGFMILAPVLAVGFLAISKTVSNRGSATSSDTIAAFRTNASQLWLGGTILMLLFIAWVRFASLLFALSFSSPVSDSTSFFQALFSTSDGLIFLALFFGSGAIFATLAFALSAFGVPAIFSRRVGAMEAMLASAKFVLANKKAMLAWAFMISIIMFLGFATLMLGLVIAIPVVGYATWHAYREVESSLNLPNG